LTLVNGSLHTIIVMKRVKSQRWFSDFHFSTTVRSC
jgi:hypothetical protein